MEMNQVCSECIMDKDDPEISFDEKGVCNYCRQFKAHPEDWQITHDRLERWQAIVNKIKKDGEGKPFNCIIGVSGGVDSSFLVHVAQTYGLAPLLIHAANGFDTELSKQNMACVAKNAGFDLKIVEVDPEEFRSLQLAFLRASVLDTDIPADYILEAVQAKEAVRHKIKYILTGWNWHSEAFMPSAWTYRNKNDYTNLRNIHNKFGEGVKLRKWIRYGFLEKYWDRKIHHIQKVCPLNYVPYTKKGTIQWLQQNWGWQPYRDKHGENIFTRFYQRYILVEKFGIDKRKMHFSNLIRSGGMTREEALEEIKKSPYNYEMFLQDKAFILNKLRLSEEEFDRIMKLPPRKHEEFGTDKWLSFAIVVSKIMRKLKK